MLYVWVFVLLFIGIDNPLLYPASHLKFFFPVVRPSVGRQARSHRQERARPPGEAGRGIFRPS
uniref:Uncharacterized protein n=1 Tax=Anguilla anguilla TaxID=7936 RepID=A0A0E9RM85_ANGAN